MRLRFLLTLTLSLLCLIPHCLATADMGDEHSDQSHSAFPRHLDFRVMGLFSANGSFLVHSMGLVEKDFSLIVISGGRYETASRFLYRDHFTTTLKNGMSPENIIGMLIIRHQAILNGSKDASCSLNIAIGIQECRLQPGQYVKVMILERIQLRTCRQSSISDERQPDNCQRAYALVQGLRMGLSDCSLTKRESNPWWKAEAPASFKFEKFDIYSAAELNQWTQNFDIFVEEAACIRVKNSPLFIKKTLDCGLHGSSISVRVTGPEAIQLAICELVAYGSPGGCYQIHRSNNKCHREFPGHVGQGRLPYPPGLNCEWTIEPVTRSVALLLQFKDFSTNGPKDFVALYEGKGTHGRLLARFSGRGAHAPPAYKKPGVYGAQNYILSGNISNTVTVQFVTSKSEGASRTVDTHRGFFLSYTLIKSDGYVGAKDQTNFDEAKRVCGADQYLERLYTTCAKRGGINPVSIYGQATGGSMLATMEASGGKVGIPITVPLMQSNLGYMPFTLPEFDFDLTDETVALMCSLYRPPERPPRYFAECCCKYCSRRELSSYCLWSYGSTDQCANTLQRVKSNPEF